MREISTMLVEAMLGKEHVETAMLVRNAILVSSLIFNCEAWYGLTKKEVEVLEKVDEQLLRKILGCSAKTPKYLMYLELGVLPIGFIIQSRRIGFLKYILDQKDSSLVKQVFNAQNADPRSGDWISTVKKDLRKLNLNYSFDEIKQFSRFTFKNILKDHIEKAALKNLTLRIKSKGKEITYDRIEMQNYLKSDSELSLEEKKLNFKLRTRTTDLRMNMKNKNTNLECVACEKKGEINFETQEHTFECINYVKSQVNSDLDLKEIFLNHRSTDKIKHIVKHFQKTLKEREDILKKREDNENS